MRKPTLEDAIRALGSLADRSQEITGTVVDTMPIGEKTAYVVKDGNGTLTGIVPLIGNTLDRAEKGKEVSIMPLRTIGIGKPKGTNLPTGVKFYFGVPGVSSYGANQ